MAGKVQILTSEGAHGAIVAEAKPVSAVRMGLGRLLLLAVWFALLTGLAEFTLLTIARLFLHRYIDFMGQHMVWMSPLADIILFSIVALLLFILSRSWPRLVSPRTATFFFAFLGFLTLLLLYQRLHRYAALLLAAGLGLQTARFLAARWLEFYTFVRWTIPRLVALVILIAIGISGWQWWGDRRAESKLAAAPRDATNVLLIVLDAVRARNLSLYGYARSTTPRLEEMAKTGIVFESAIATAPWTLASHASMFTGRYPHELSAGFAAALDPTYSTLSEVLSTHGYVTAGFVANTWYCGPASGLSRGFTHYEDLAISPGQIMLSSSIGRTASDSVWLRRISGYNEELGRKTAPEISESFLRWLARKDPQRPFFAFLNYFDAHEPYLPPKPFDVRFGPKQPRMNPRHGLEWQWKPSEIQAEMDAYDGAIAYLDQQVGILLDELRKRGLLDNTLVIVTADHGEEFGEHGMVDHGYSVYAPSLQVPLVIAYQKLGRPGIRIKEPVTLRDLPATILDVLKLENEVHFPGTSFAGRWDTTATPAGLGSNVLLSELEVAPNLPAWYPLAKGEMKSLVIAPYHYIRNGDSREELYDLELDPLEKHNLALAEENRSTLDRFRSSLDATLSRYSVLSH